VTDHPADGPAAPVTGLSHVQLLVSDVEVSAAWYRAALGLVAYVEDLDSGYVALRHRGAGLVFVLTTSPDPGPVGDGSAPEPGDLDHLALAVPDGTALAAWADHLEGIGITHAGVVLENGNPSLQLRDPDGIAIELVAPGPRPHRSAR
jgi:catechol 2,3-dioxygenase-like lactoylglutathione lyase family enzyme